jgi:hypothetical protein|tara:strand:+ start:520 stop:636 length:117 start_codon:yes stop_codon:yes gene_type:complete
MMLTSIFDGLEVEQNFDGLSYDDEGTWYDDESADEHGN